MSTDVEHVIDTAHHPEITIRIFAGAVRGEVHPRNVAPVLLFEALRVAIDGAQHRRPRLLDDQVTAGAGGHRLAFPRDYVGSDAGKWPCRRAGLAGNRSWKWCDHDRASL